MYILGIHSAYYDPSACLIHNGIIVAAAEEERFTRRKHGKIAKVGNPDELPENAIAYCLKTAGITLYDVDKIGFSLFPLRRLQNIWIKDIVTNGDWGSVRGEEEFYKSISRIPKKLQIMGFSGEFSWLDHHLCHAASAFYTSPFREAGVLVIDGIGEIASATFFHGKERTLTVLQEINYPSSLGFLWEKISKYLGFSELDATKIMGLAAYGDPTIFMLQFERIVKLLPDGRFSTDNSILRFRVEDYSELEVLFQMRKREYGQELTQMHKAIAAALQEATNRVFVHMAKHLFTQIRSTNLCLAGGVALNCTANKVLHETGPFANLYIQPAANDAGTSIGAALVLHNSTNELEKGEIMKHVYLGPAFSDDEIEQTLIKEQTTYKRLDAIEYTVAEFLSQKKIIGWYQGRMEFGPRALGNRSLLADPRDRDMREILNNRVKHREIFRPFAPSVLEEEANMWFDITKPTHASDFMLMAYKVKEHVKEIIPAVVHIDGTSRIQIVSREVNDKYYRVISEFFKLTGVPLILNTSFNDNEPIVCTPKDAVETFKRTHMDYLAIGSFLVSK